MSKPISICIKETREKIVKALNESQLPPCLLEVILNPIYQQITVAAQQEITQAEKQLAEEENNA